MGNINDGPERLKRCLCMLGSNPGSSVKKIDILKGSQVFKSVQSLKTRLIFCVRSALAKI